MKQWNEIKHHNQIAYVWQSPYVFLGVGTTSPNPRVNPKMTMQALLYKKDAGKTFIASYISRLTNERVELTGCEDKSKKVSRNTTELELDLKNKLTKGKFMVFKNIPYTKVQFMDEVFTPHVNSIFGTDSIESMITTLASGDGDIWGRFSRHPKSKQALENIIQELLWVDQ